MSEWKYYRSGKIVPITEDEARNTFDYWGVLSDDRGMACLMHEQMWAEIDRLRAELAARDERIAGLEAALRTWNKALSQIPCWARKWDAFREARSATKAALDE